MKNENLIDLLLRESNEHRYFNMVVILAIIIVPILCAWLSKWLTNRKIERLYKNRLEDKDDEIERLVAHNKRLENALLKRQRQ